MNLTVVTTQVLLPILLLIWLAFFPARGIPKNAPFAGEPLWLTINGRFLVRNDRFTEEGLTYTILFNTVALDRLGLRYHAGAWERW